ncbi:hypothetical protein MBBAR_11c00470 [Methanobrevibacter arboriphilus JCM 13429 = DSM 1125]|uniref:Uncharacterized protein n=1 Tax=Methanobrevibacter arboriphilus JCM 13429 = DSM 1125 TaxID=1300164 RepID=A0A1V6N1Y6_METAZ|nr:hypothetical protein MBBAR_11c00470 [Methanobrevibacter arboriphilus JCM 13429 = DSM 1125]
MKIKSTTNKENININKKNITNEKEEYSNKKLIINIKNINK